jgi:Skp family chaperone for outer membrane proteins
MKTFRLIAAAFFIAAIFSISAFAQVVQTPVGKVALINTLAFEDEKAGIVKYTQAMKGVVLEFKKELDDLGALYKRIEALEKEIIGLETQLKAAQANPQVPISPTLQTSYSTKADDYGKLVREHKFKQDDLKVRFDRRRQIVMQPISQEIGKAMNDFTKQKGYAMLLDGAKLEEAGILLGLDRTYDVTTDFIKYFNTLPATTAVKTNTTPTTTPSVVPVKP